MYWERWRSSSLLEVFNLSLESLMCSYVMYLWPVLMHQWNWQRAEMRQGAKAKWWQHVDTLRILIGPRETSDGPGRRSVEAMEEGKKKGKRKQNGSQELMKVMQAVFWLVTCPAKNKHHQRHLEWCQWPWAQSSGKNSSVKNVGVKGEWLDFNENQYDLVFKRLGSGH